MATLPAPYHLRPTRIADHHAYLRGCGWNMTNGDAYRGGVWLSNGTLAGWFADSAAAVRAVENGWPHLPEVVTEANR